MPWVCHVDSVKKCREQHKEHTGPTQPVWLTSVMACTEAFKPPRLSSFTWWLSIFGRVNWVCFMPEWWCRYIIWINSEDSNFTEAPKVQFQHYFWPSMTRKIPFKINLHTCQVIAVCGMLTAILHYTWVLLSPFQDKTAGSTPQLLPNQCRVSLHIVRRRAILKDRCQATSLNKYLVIFVAWRLNVICRTLPQQAPDPRIIRTIQLLNIWVDVVSIHWRMNASLSQCSNGCRYIKGC